MSTIINRGIREVEKLEFYSKWALRIGLAAAVIYDIIFIQYWVGAAGGAAILGLTYLIDYINSRKKVFGSKLLFIFYSFCILAQVMGVMFRFYQMITWWDTFVHLLSGLVLAYAGDRLLKVLDTSERTQGLVRFLFVVGIACIGGVVWEICEFTADTWFGLDTQCAILTGVGDTMVDLIADLAGGILYGAGIALSSKLNRNPW